MKKKLIIVLLFIIIIIIYFVYSKNTFNSLIDNTITYDNKINYNTNISLKIKSNITSSKINYDIVKSSNIKKIILTNYKDNKKENSILKYVVNNNIYAFNGKTYELQNTKNEDFVIKYKYLKNSKIKYYYNNTYVISMKIKDAYNLIYDEDIMKENKNDYIDVLVTRDKKNNFIKKISYKINNINKSKNKNDTLKYEVKITNSNINNHDTLKLPFKK